MLRTVPPLNRLGVRLTLLIAAVVLSALGTSALLSITRLERHVLAETSRGAELLSDTIRTSLDHHMMADDREVAYRMMRSMAQHPGIRAVRMLNGESAITFSTDPDELGETPNRDTATCAVCHRGPVNPKPCTAAAHAVLAREDGKRDLVVMAPIYNEPRCVGACHAHRADQRVLGVLNLHLSLDEMDEGTRALSRGMLSVSLLVLLGLALPVALFMRGQVMRPIRALVLGTQRVADDDLSHEIEVRSNDELAVLARSFNVMTGSLRQARERLNELMSRLERQVEERTAALRATQAQLVQSEKLSSLGRLSASIAHEINNPLMGILTTTKLMIRTLGEASLDQREKAGWLRQLQLVQRETERCRTIVRNLLDFARQRSPELKPTDVNAVIEEALSVAQNQLSLQKIELQRDLSPAVTVLGDFGQLRQAVLNIVLNACDAMPKGGLLVVSSRHMEGGEVVIVDVSDSGPGIPQEHLSKIFDPFYTTKDKGTGLGLSVVYGIIERHGGHLEVARTGASGTCMRLRLRVAGPGPAPPEGAV